MSVECQKLPLFGVLTQRFCPRGLFARWRKVGGSGEVICQLINVRFSSIMRLMFERKEDCEWQIYMLAGLDLKTGLKR